MKRTVRLGFWVLLAMIGFACFLVACAKDVIESPTMEQTSYEFVRTSDADLVVGVDLKNGEFDSLCLSEGQTPVETANYRYDAGKITIAAEYLNTLSGEVSFLIKNKTGGSVAFQVNIVVNTQFDADAARIFAYDSDADIVFHVQFQGEGVAEIKCGDTLLSAQDYSFSEETLTIKNTYLKTLAGKNTFELKTTNGQTHTFSIASTMLFREDFESEDADPAAWSTKVGEGNEILDEGGNKVFNFRTGSTFLFGPDWFDCGFETGKTYVITFKMKNNEGATGGFGSAATMEEGYTYPNANLILDFNPSNGWSGGNNGTIGGSGQALTAGEDGWYTVSAAFECLEGLRYIEMFPGGGNALIDEISIVEL